MCTRRPSTSCSIDQSIGESLEYNLVFHKLFQKGIIHQVAPPTAKWVPPTNTQKLLEKSRAKAMLSEWQCGKGIACPVILTVYYF